MPIVGSDLQMFLSGGSTGAGNTDPAESLGSVITSTAVDQNTTLNNLFDDVGSTESADGDIEYRCVWIKNNHASLTLQNASVYIYSNTPSTFTDMAIGFEPGVVGAVPSIIADENTAPAGVSWTSSTGEGNKITVTGSDMLFSEIQALWVRRTVSAGASAYANDAVILRILGDTLP